MSNDSETTEATFRGMLMAADLYEQVNPASDDERMNGDPGAGAMGAVIEFRDLIRNKASKLCVAKEVVSTQTKSIPVSAAKKIAEQYGYDQVVVMARKIGPDGCEHVTTYGVDETHCDVAARMGHYLKHKIMGWPDVN